MVEATGFEPVTSWSRTKRATKLHHASIKPSYFITLDTRYQNIFFISQKKALSLTRLLSSYCAIGRYISKTPVVSNPASEALGFVVTLNAL